MQNYYWLIVIGVLAIAYVFLVLRQKRQEKRNVEALNNFRVGDKVITHIGIYGRIKRIYNTTYGKTCILEIGNNNKVDIEIDMRYIAGIDEKTAVADEPNKQVEENAKSKEESAEIGKETEETKPQSQTQKKSKKNNKK